MGTARELPVRYARVFHQLGDRIRSYRIERRLAQQDMLAYWFSPRHWQMIESGRPITISTLLRICEAFELKPEQLLAGLSRGVGRRRR